VKADREIKKVRKTYTETVGIRSKTENWRRKETDWFGDGEKEKETGNPSTVGVACGPR